MNSSFGSEPSEYDSWANCGIGSYVEIETSSEADVPGIEELRDAAKIDSSEFSPQRLQEIVRFDWPSRTMKGRSQSTLTLLEITSEWVKVQMEVKANALGKPMDFSHVLTIDLASEGDTRFRRDVSLRDGDEEVLIAGRPIPCRILHQKATTDGMKAWKSIWVSDRIPGGMAKCQWRMETPMKFSTKLFVTSFEKK
jgi:hypothetical protein